MSAVKSVSFVTAPLGRVEYNLKLLPVAGQAYIKKIAKKDRVLTPKSWTI